MTGTSLSSALVRWYRRRRQPSARYRQVLRVAELDNVPDRPHPRRIYLVGAPQSPKWVAFDCPCGHGHRIEINVGRRSPWSITGADGGMTLRPSVDRDDGHRRCHFWLRDSRVTWC